MMKKLGYEPYFAGQWRPPPPAGANHAAGHGAAAFLIAEALNIPYIKVALYAAIPALLYFASIFITVDLRAAKLGLKPVTREQASINKKLFFKYTHFFLSPVILIYLLAGPKLSLQRGFSGPPLPSLCSAWFTGRRGLPEKICRRSGEGILSALSVAAACACAGIILGVVNMTGLGLRLSGILVELGGGSLLFTLFLTMITSLILGMGYRLRHAISSWPSLPLQPSLRWVSLRWRHTCSSFIMGPCRR